MHYSTWYLFNLGKIFGFLETHLDVSMGAEEYSAKVSGGRLCNILERQ